MDPTSPMDTSRCTAHRSDGTPCQAPAIRGGTVCQAHGGSAPAVRRRAEIRRMVQDWRLDTPEVDPGDQLARMIAVTAHRQATAAWLMDQLAGGADPDDWRRLLRQLIGARETSNGVVEYRRELQRVEAEERERLAKFCELAIRAGLDERRVQLAEDQARVLVGVLDAVRARLALTDAQAELWRSAVVAALTDAANTHGLPVLDAVPGQFAG